MCVLEGFSESDQQREKLDYLIQHRISVDGRRRCERRVLLEVSDVEGEGWTPGRRSLADVSENERSKLKPLSFPSRICPSRSCFGSLFTLGDCSNVTTPSNPKPP